MRWMLCENKEAERAMNSDLYHRVVKLDWADDRCAA